MKNIKAFALTLVCALLTFSACNHKDSAKAYTALVTYEAENGNARLQLNDSTVLIPSGLKPDKDTVVRALVNFSFTDDLGENSNAPVRNVEVYDIASILTKKPVEDLGIDNGINYGDDPIEIIEDWLTIGEDGYLNLRFSIQRSNPSVAHGIALVKISAGSGDYVFELRHNANGDGYGNFYDGVVAFDLNEFRPSDGSPINVKIKWKGYERQKEDFIKVTFRKQ
ncbi:MAG: NigD-like protein [Bacteroidales bacterium]|nr:NigD-like protein [Bacteroidales bacterium]MDD7136355.1 NigD-like protein [Bacteroidales bacterium]MDD7622932.1 NigD-like protein [Bacteroidales bacterium]